MTFSIRRLVRTAISSPAAVAAPVQTRRGPVSLTPQQQTQVAGGSPKGGWLLTDTTASPKGGWA